MITVHDKIPFFRKIMENEFKLQLSEASLQLQQSYTERQEKQDKRLDQEMKDRTERQRLVLDAERRTRLGQAEADLKQSLLRQRQELMNELRQDVTLALKDYLASEDFVATLQSASFNRAEGSAALKNAFGNAYADVSYVVINQDGIILYDDTDGSRIDLTLSRYLERYEKVLSQTFQEMAGV